MATTIVTKNSSTAGAAPTAGDLVQGELAVNVTDKALYTENASGTVVKLNTPSIVDNGNATAITIDSSENVGVGVTPSAWSLAGATATQVRYASVMGYLNNSYIQSNAYFNSSWKYINNDFAQQYIQASGQHQWLTAASGTAGNAISFTQAMTLDASGNLGVGVTSPTDSINFGRIIDVASSSLGGGTYYRNSGTAYYAAVGYDGSNGYIGTWGASAGPLRIYTNSSERARIDSSGNLLVGVTADTMPNAGMALQPAQGNMKFRCGTANTFTQFYNQSNTKVGSIETNGTTTSYVTSSDYRLKENVQPMTGALSVVESLKPCTYTWKSDGSASQGFIAHELAEVVPDCVTGEKDAVDAEGNPIYQGIDTSFLVATLTAAIKEQQALIASLTARITALEA